MTKRLTKEEACTTLGIDAWGLERLAALGELNAQPDGSFSAKDINQLKAQRAERRTEALDALAALDAPHMARTP